MKHPLSKGNVSRADIDTLTQFLQKSDQFSQGDEVRAFETQWSQWLGRKHSLFVNSGSSANLLTLAALKEFVGTGEVLISVLNWPSSIALLELFGFTIKFVDCDPKTFGVDPIDLKKKISKETKILWLTHVLGFSSLRPEMESLRKEFPNLVIVEDASQAVGAQANDKKLGYFGDLSNFSFFYSHQISTIEGGMISTDNPDWYQCLRMLRSHGRLGEANSERFYQKTKKYYDSLPTEMLFLYPGFNVKATELQAVLGKSQLNRVKEIQEQREENLRFFLSNLDSTHFETEYPSKGSASFALPIVLKHNSPPLLKRICSALKSQQIEFRRGICAGGNQLRQPYARKIARGQNPRDFPNAEFIHFNGLYIGNHLELSTNTIQSICDILNEVPKDANHRHRAMEKSAWQKTF